MRYLKLWGVFFRASWMAETEYRLNIIVRVLGEGVWYTVQLSVFEVLYTHTTTINGWDIHAMRLFLGTLFLTDNIYMFFFQDNMEALNQMVRKGELDLYLTKPINSQFMVSCRKVAVAYLLNMLILMPYVTWAMLHLSHPVGAGQVVTYVTSVVGGVFCYYSLRFMFGTLVIVLQDAGNVQFIWHQLFRLATRPDPIYPGPFRIFLLTVFPVAFMASVPARMVVESFNPALALASLAMASGLVVLSHKAWTTALKHYSSASS